MKPHLERRAALMRLQNSEQDRRRLWAHIDRLQDRGQIDKAEAARMKQAFWEELRRDQLIAIGQGRVIIS